MTKLLPLDEVLYPWFTDVDAGTTARLPREPGLGALWLEVVAVERDGAAGFIGRICRVAGPVVDTEIAFARRTDAWREAEARALLALAREVLA